MPELPEVETLRRNLERTLIGHEISSVAVTLPKLFIGEHGLGIEDLVGGRIKRLSRRAKFLVVELSNDLALVFHLRLSGQLVHHAADGTVLATGGHPVPAF